MDGLKHLLKASSQKVVEELFLLAFNNRDSKLTIDELKQAAEALQLSAEEAEEVHICNFDYYMDLGHLDFSWTSLRTLDFLLVDKHTQTRTPLRLNVCGEVAKRVSMMQSPTSVLVVPLRTFLTPIDVTSCLLHCTL
jgi:hypothetical protein